MSYYIKNTKLFYVIALIIVFSHNLKAGTTGKISGIVLDKITKEPLIGCNILVESTGLGAATDLDGNYFILNVPPGSYNVKALMIGYSTLRMTSVEVVVDLTSTVDFSLSTEAIEGQEVTVVAVKKTVRLDQTSMASVVSSKQIESLPVTEINDLIELQAGVVRDPSGGLHVRGGRSGEVSFWVDGLSTTDSYDGSVGQEIETSSIQELQVISGTFNAEYGNAMSGIVNVVTKDGGEKLQGGMEIYAGGFHTFDSKLHSISSPFANWQPFEDVNGNGQWESPEWFNDFNNNLQWDQDEPWDDANENGIWDMGEPLNSDLGSDGQRGDPTDDGSMVPSVTSNNNGQRNEPSLGEGDGIAQWGEHVFSLDENGYIDKLNVILNPYQIKNFNGYLSGPIPGLSNYLTFYSNIRYFNTLGKYYGKQLFLPDGSGGNEKISSLNPFSKISVQGKLTFKPTSMMKISYSLFYAEKSFKNYDSFYKYNPTGLMNHFEKDLSHIFNLTHTLSQRTYYELKMIDFQSSYWQYLYKDENDERYVDPEIMRVPAWSFAPGGTQNGRYSRETNYNVLKFDIVNQFNQFNQVKSGFEIKIYDLWADDKSLQYGTTGDWSLTEHGDTLGFNPQAGSRLYPYTPVIFPTHQPEHDYFRAKPLELSTYFQDKIELEDLIVNIGLRFDYFDSKWHTPKNDLYPGNRKYYLATTEDDTSVFWEHEFESLHPNVTIIDSLNTKGAVKVNELINTDIIDTEAWDEVLNSFRWEYGYNKTKPAYQLSPRIGISYPITDKGAIHVSYGYFFQIPQFSFLYENPEFEISNSTSGGILGNAALKPEKTVMYEVGVKQEIASFTSFDLTLFYRDTRDWVGVSAPINKYPIGVYYKWENKDYANTRGFTIAIKRDLVGGFGASLDYSWMVAEGTFSDPSEAYFNAQSEDEAPRISLIPLNWDQTHTLNASVSFGRKNWSASVIGKFWSGKPYTPEPKMGVVSGASAFSGFAENSDRRPSFINFDFRSSYFISIFDYRISVFCNIYNMFDFQNEMIVWNDTGRATYTLTSQDVSETDITRIGNLNEHILRPNYFSEPRKINIGLSMNF